MALSLLAVLLSSRFHLVLLDPGNVYAERRFTGAGILASALAVLGLSLAAKAPRLRWVALGLTILALGSVLFGDLLVRSVDEFSIATGLYGSLLTRGILAGLFAIGLLLPDPPVLSGRMSAALVVAYLLVVAGVTQLAGSLPALASFERMPFEPVTGVTRGFTPLYWIVTGITAALAGAVAWSTVRNHRAWGLGVWIAVAATLLAGVLAHAAFRPSLFGISSEVTTANLLTSSLILLCLLGATYDVRTIADRVAADRDALSVERHRLVDLARLRADFTAMVAHELAQPLLAIRRSADVLKLQDLEPPLRQGVEAIAVEATALFAMIDDVRASGVAESDDFSVELAQIDLDRLIDRVEAFGAALLDNHTLHIERIERGAGGEVWADAERIDQVLRNLLGNAVRYSLPDTAITLRAIPVSREIIRIEVEDEGPGIGPSELSQAFEKFQRGQTSEPGLGLGLYLSRRILRASGGDLHYRTGVGGGACFWFDLPRVSWRSHDHHPAG